MTPIEAFAYRNRLDPAVEELAIVMDSQTEHMEDHEIIYLAAAKIKTLKAMLIAAGVAEGIVTAVMKEVQ